ncbi:polysaccharide deacetylase family protein [Virgibacillus salexigens]|uniref:Peptidoglycan-N-acetylmuramic acid deacetylase PdaC n=1 Tax=Virgibacillus kapii TaxID=1638645 RepID=A0ABQ2DVH7_9BACI|nr:MULTISPECIES: polysaccharide deacetylase family protein [Virgibacillus]MYL42526.1 polysaccharide deacetylase family protein [Virgibacillus massiliensis]GGJ74514.1 peptidoglycan-N-acetylmuramic acid deacetylase PdaC [Virgibacillus kapii]
MHKIIRLKWPAWAILFIVVIGSIITFTYWTKHSQAVTEVQQKALSNYPGLHLETLTKETDTYTLAISKPIAESEAINKPIETWINQQEKKFLTNVEENNQLLDKDRRAHLNIHVETEKLADSLYSLVFTAYQITGGANGQETIKTFNVDVKGNKMLDLKDILKGKDEAYDTIRTSVREQIDQNEDLKPYVFQDAMEDALRNPVNWKWSLNEKALHLYFDEYEIAAGAAGTIEINIPIAQLRAYLQDDVAEQLQVTVVEPNTEGQSSVKEKALDPNGKYIALTFDDGPHPKVTPRVLQTLHDYQAKATFYMLGSQVEYYPSIVRDVFAQGHEVGNHTEKHTDLTQLDQAMIEQEIKETKQKIYQASGYYPTSIRPPYGAYNESVKQVTNKLDTPMVLWSVDSLDWKTRDPDAINQVVSEQVASGSIVLMHDIHPTTADALPQLLSTLKEEGYEFVTVSELLSLQKAKGNGPFYGKS